MSLFCGLCNKVACATRDIDNMPKSCPSLEFEKMEDVKKHYHNEPDYTIARESAISRIEKPGAHSRLVETIDFMRRCNYKKIGIAFCKMVKKDALFVHNTLVSEGFEVHSVICRMGGIMDSELEKEGENTIGSKGYETMCNPIGQALFLNNLSCDFNVVLGLCVGHDTMFYRHSAAPFTVLGIKDRKNGCTPVNL